MALTMPRLQAKQKFRSIETPPNVLERKFSVGTVSQSKTRLLANNRSLALLLNKKKIEVHRLREANRKLTMTFELYKNAYKKLGEKYNSSVQLLKRMQQMTPKIQQDVAKAFGSFDKIFSLVEKFDEENWENIGLLNNLNVLEDLSNKAKLPRKRARVHKVRPMKFGLVLGNPVVSLHRLQPEATALAQLEELDEFTTDSDIDPQEEMVFDEADSIASTGNTRASPDSPLSANTTTALISPMQPSQKVAELTLSVPVLQPMEANVSSPKKMRLTPTGSPVAPSENKSLQQKQLTSPCCVIVENIHDAGSTSPVGSSVYATPRSGLTVPMTVSTPSTIHISKRRHVSRQLDSDDDTPKKKLTEQELIKALTPLQVKIKLKPLQIESNSDADSPPIPKFKKRPHRKSITPRVRTIDDSDSEEETVKRSEKSPPLIERVKSKAGRNATNQKKRQQPAKKRATKKATEGSQLTVKIWGKKNFAKNKIEDQVQEPVEILPNVSRRRGKQNAEDVLIDQNYENGHSDNSLDLNGVEKKKNSIAGRHNSDQSHQVSKKTGESDKRQERPKNTKSTVILDVEEKTDEMSKDAGSEKEPSKSVDSDLNNKIPDLMVNGNIVSSESASCELMRYKPGPKSKKLKQKPSEAKNNDVEQVVKTKEPESTPVPETKPVSKKHKPMPLSKKRELGLVVEDGLEILSETVNVRIKEEKQSPPEELRRYSQHDYMRSFIQRLSQEDPLEGTSRQHLYKNPPQPGLPNMEKKMSLRQHENRSYEESPVTDTASHDDETWYPKNHTSGGPRNKKK